MILTYKCNNNCISCIFDTRFLSHYREPNLEKIKKRLLEDRKEKYVGLTGGEPTLRKELLQILKYIKKINPEKYVLLVSNGRRFADKKYAKKFKKIGLKNYLIGIPLYSHNPRVHDRITQVKGSWNETINGIKNLLLEKARIEIRILVERANYQDLEKTAKFIVRELNGIERITFINLKYTGNAFINRNKILINYSEAVRFVQKAIDIIQKATTAEIKLYHFPLCILEKKYRKFAEGITKDTRELTFLPECEICKEKTRCPRIWKTYLPLSNKKEFFPLM